MAHAHGLPLVGPGLFVLGAGAPWMAAAHAQIEFDAGTLYPTAADVAGVAVADMNGDSWRDIIVAETIESLSLYANRGDGSFFRAGSFYDPAATLSLLNVGDLDGDGDQDIAWIVGRADSGNPRRDIYELRVSYNSGDGSSAGMQTIELTWRAPGAMAIGDLDQDGGGEIILFDGYARDTNASLRVFVRQSGSFVLGQTLSLGRNDIRDVALGDIDRDGDLDVAALALDTYDDSYYGFKIYDSEVAVLFNDGSGTLQVGRHVALPYGNDLRDPLPVALRDGDFDGDSDRDFVVGVAPFNSEGPLLVHVIESVQGGSSFNVLPPTPLGDREWYILGLTVADFDVDGDLDFIVNHTANDTWLFDNEGSFEFAVEQIVMNLHASARPASGELDGDGLIDMVGFSVDGLRVTRNVTPYDGPLLEHATLRRGEPTSLSVRGAGPGELVHFLYSRQDAGNSLGVPSLGGLTLDFSSQFRTAGSAVADASGIAELALEVPPRAPLTTVVLQAVIRRGPGGADSVKTPFRTAVIMR